MMSIGIQKFLDRLLFFKWQEKSISLRMFLKSSKQCVHERTFLSDNISKEAYNGNEDIDSYLVKLDLETAVVYDVETCQNMSSRTYLKMCL